jgi:hypothetical protein
MTNGADSPEMVSPLTTQVARARTGPKFAGIFGSTQLPSGFTRTFRFKTETMQFSLSGGGVWPDAAEGAPTIPAAATRTQRVRLAIRLA